MLTYHTTSALLGVGLAVTIFYLVRKNHLHTRYAISWLLASGGICVLGLSPTLVDRLGGLFGINYPPTLILVMAIAVLIIKLLLMDIDRSRTQVQAQRMIQRLGILEERITALHTQKGPSVPPGPRNEDA